MRARTMLLGLTFLTFGCFSLRGSSGGGETSVTSMKLEAATAVALPAGYRIEALATKLTFPTGVTFDDAGVPYVVESGYSYGETFTTPRLLRIVPGGRAEPIASGADTGGPWNGVAFHGGKFFVAEGGELGGGRILEIAMNGAMRPLVEGLPSMGDHHVNGPVVGPDGAIYFAIGTATNSGIVGDDNAEQGWLKRHPSFHDIPCQDVTLAGANFESKSPLRKGAEQKVMTGAFVPFGTATEKGQVIKGSVPCSGAVFKMVAGAKPELVAWGFRNPFGLAFAPDGKLFVTDNQYDDRGSRPIFGTGDLLWAVTPGTWYGWPDYAGGRLLVEHRFKAPGKPLPMMVLDTPPNVAPKPAAFFGVHSSSNGFDFSRSRAFGHVGEAFVAQFGDEAPKVGKVLHPVGFKVVRVNTTTGVVEDFATNKGKTNGPASLLKSAGLERPVAVRFDPAGAALYVVDFGIMTMDDAGPHPRPQTGSLWRITKEAGQ